MRILVLKLVLDLPSPENWGGELRCCRSAVGIKLYASPNNNSDQILFVKQTAVAYCSEVMKCIIMRLAIFTFSASPRSVIIDFGR